ncbi:major capsid protein [Peromfec virus RodF5_5]|uniref:Major capsid protein n=1 Tax=Peromfec virus RodF5_5 TaxID=2929341 RepID=A0A976N2V9_9VIRU|nr:major capsid protein [Peromfec virus RodF5_5]
MSQVFGKDASRPNRVNRNTFDMSHQNNLSMRFGELYPCLVEPVIPGDTFKCDVAFGVRALPTAFPVQTKVRMDTHFFYVRNRNLWKDWQNFIGMTGNTDAYKLPTVTGVHSTGSLGDYLGVPTTVVGSNRGNIPSFSASVRPLTIPVLTLPVSMSYGNLTLDLNALRTGDFHSLAPTSVKPSSVTYLDYSGANHVYYCMMPFVRFANNTAINLLPNSTVQITLTTSGTTNDTLLINAILSGDCKLVYFYNPVDNDAAQTAVFAAVQATNAFGAAKIVDSGDNFVSFEFTLSDAASLTSGGTFALLSTRVTDSGTLEPFFTLVTDTPTGDVLTTGYPYARLTQFSYYYDSVVDATDSNLTLQNINALPFRAYESIYNSFYRDQRNNPYIVDGVHDPNVYLPSTDGGFDSYPYALRKRNWEQDFMTSAVQSPQQGTAPLVGITSSGVATFSNEDGSTTKVKLTTADDGDTVTGAEFSDDTPNSVARSIVNLATSGFSISDFRGVNALTRWLEINMRRGLKYKDQILSHFGVDVHYNVLDMPEFIGGVTQWFDSTQINQTSEGTTQDPLGSYAGQMSAVGGNNHTIQQYCDEHGYIIAICSIVPVPVYDQLLPKDFIKSSPLDYFFPEFGHLGFQPVSYTEVAPYQAALFGVNPNDVFGYQRAWYEYLARTDEAHGDFRTSFRDFILSRKFKNVPSLSPDFLTVSPDQLNNVFTVEYIEDDDGTKIPVMPFLGQIHFKEFIKRPIPRFGTPKLEPDI